ncbi:MAG TPA: hypothetical protein PKA90_15595 [Ignavibacteria bacterium]|nr:hypothetical protein [Ignavibacteria bacterium]HMR41842.1 hypothetical protein [Ignavibacteria bacterium]
MNTIIALRGKGNSGKSNTLRILDELLSQNDFESIRSSIELGYADFISIFSKNGKLIGITSSGDTYDLVHDALSELINDRCVICVCACRSYDRVPPGTNAEITEFTNYENLFLEKTLDENINTQDTTNRNDANRLLTEIYNLL